MKKIVELLKDIEISKLKFTSIRISASDIICSSCKACVRGGGKNIHFYYVNHYCPACFNKLLEEIRNL